MKRRYIAKDLIKRWARRLLCCYIVYLCAIHLLWIPFVAGKKARRYGFWNKVEYYVTATARKNGFPTDDANGLHESPILAEYLPQSMAEISPSFAKHFVLTTGKQYDAFRLEFMDVEYYGKTSTEKQYDVFWDKIAKNMIAAEKYPHRTVFPFPFGTWVTYAKQSGRSPDLSVSKVSSDLESRQFCARIAKLEGGGFNLAASFIPDVMIYALAIGAVILYVRRQYGKRRENSAINEQFSRLGAALFDFRDRTGRIPKSLKELGVDASTGEYDAVLRRGLLFLHQYGCGVALATARPWRKSFGIRKRALAILDDGTIVSMRGVFQLDSFYDKIRVACEGLEIGRFYVNKKHKLRFQRRESYAKAFCPLGMAVVLLILGYAPMVCAVAFPLLIPSIIKSVSRSIVMSHAIKILNFYPFWFPFCFLLSLMILNVCTLLSFYAESLHLRFSLKSIFARTFFTILKYSSLLVIIAADLWTASVLFRTINGDLYGAYVLFGSPFFLGGIVFPEFFYDFIAFLYGLV